MSKMYPKFRSVDESPGPNEPIWKGVVKIVGIICACGTLVVGGILAIASLVNRVDQNEKRQEEQQQSQAMEEGNTGLEVILLDQDGTFMGRKMTYDGHDYLKVSNSGGIVHSESCPCKSVPEEAKP